MASDGAFKFLNLVVKEARKLKGVSPSRKCDKKYLPVELAVAFSCFYTKTVRCIC